MYYLAGNDLSVPLPFKDGAQFVVPDANSVFYVLRDSAGTIVIASTPISTTVDETSAIVAIPGSANAITGDIEKRSVDYTWTVAGRQYRNILTYQLTGWLNHTVTPADVRGYIGLGPDELDDDEVDLVSAYFTVAEAITKPALVTQLARTDLGALRANRAIMLTAVLAVLPSLPFRAAQTEQEDTNIFTRFDAVDLEALADAAVDELGQLIAGITGLIPGAFIQVILTTNTDPVTAT